MHNPIRRLPRIPVIQLAGQVLEERENLFVERDGQMHGAAVGADEQVAER